MGILRELYLLLWQLYREFRFERARRGILKREQEIEQILAESEGEGR